MLSCRAEGCDRENPIPEKDDRVLVGELLTHVVRFPSRTGGIARLTLPPSPSHSSTNSSPHPSSNPPWHSHARSAGASPHRRTPVHRSFRPCSSLSIPCSARERSPRLLAPLKLMSQSHIESWVEHTIKPTSHPDTMLRARVAKLTKRGCTRGYDCTAKTSFTNATARRCVCEKGEARRRVIRLCVERLVGKGGVAMADVKG